MTFHPTILKVETNRQLRWRGHVLLPAVLSGEHIFEIEQLSAGSVRFVHREQFTGLLVPLLWRRLQRDSGRGFNEMNARLKELAESIRRTAN
jgi:hypothetical protein